MEPLKYKNEDGALVISIKGRIDSTNAPELENEIRKVREGQQDLSVVIDCEELEYISSAGLRVLLRLQQDWQ